MFENSRFEINTYYYSAGCNIIKSTYHVRLLLFYWLKVISYSTCLSITLVFT